VTSWIAKVGDRSLFPELGCHAYTHHAAIAPVSVAVEAAVLHALKRYASLGAGAFVEYLAQRGQLRRKLETLIGAEPGSVALEMNTSRGVSDIALGIPWRAGDRVVVLRGEFPANVTPWQRAAELFGTMRRCFCRNRRPHCRNWSAI
jgi:cysteine desulfurase / selenocysteine lyase